ncbi:MAG: flavin reductase family protein [Chloroflexota bacterium]|nr:flavin reductase family protein [Chloroflexota bacterium]
MTLDQVAKKKVLRDITYGLYAVTASHEDERGVFTANWLSQASFEPPLVMLSVENDSSTLPLIRASGRFAVCPLAAGQKELAGALGRPKARAGDKFVTLELAVVDTTSGVPALAESLGYLICAVRSETPAGDSVVFIAEVEEARSFSDSPPLEMRQAGFCHAG